MLVKSPLLSHHRAFLNSLQRPVGVTLSVQGQRPGAATGERTMAPELECLLWGATDQRPEGVVELVADFGEVEAEYAAIRRGAGLLDSPHRGAVEVRGSERVDFLNRMLSQELKGLTAGHNREAFWLNRKGRIEADVFVIELGDRMLIDLDVANAAATASSLAEFVFTEDVSIRDVSSEMHHIAVYGPLAPQAIAAASGIDTFELEVGHACEVSIDGRKVAIARRDVTGSIGYELIMQRSDAGGVWEFLLASDHIVTGESGGHRRVRPIGWHAFNIARIEAGEALFNIDFGPTNLPHQVGELLSRRVSMTKGCYLGQEIVARMHSRGHSKPTLVGLRMQRDLLPVAGAQIFALPPNTSSHHESAEPTGTLGDPIGVVTSSTISPMLGAEPIAFGMIRTAAAPLGSRVLVNAEGEQVPALVGPLQHWSGQT